MLLFAEMRVTRKSSPGGLQIYFFNRFSGDVLFFYLVSFAFLYSCFFFFFWLVCLFLKLKAYILIHIRPCGRVSDKIFFTLPISGNKTTFFGFKRMRRRGFLLLLQGFESFLPDLPRLRRRNLVRVEYL